ncbi:hypothetical protein SP99_02006 [Enterobacter sp. BIDMC92]|uniref:hypothetical protein n=1 Tax=Enterobacter sp. BIDMC92 TaxID=1594172 RepID=UPI00064D37F8|nr:hypothetical protein [Enterobacter sp. BIDMC92]KLW91786.1 hypothetical protein SP99_02006 [Enterobacter sp. BIDMC92]
MASVQKENVNTKYKDLATLYPKGWKLMQEIEQRRRLEAQAKISGEYVTPKEYSSTGIRINQITE